jgi:TRAP-type C4-dicarboxylate transport system substrate-binding protein
MKRKNILKGSMVIIFLLSVFLVPSNSVAAELPKVTWKFQLCCPPMSPGFEKTVGLKRTPESLPVASGVALSQELARAVSARTNGRFKMKIFAAGELFSVPQAYEALEKGAIEMWFGPPWAFSGRNPFGYVSGSLPYSITSHDQAYDIMYKTKFREIARRAYAQNNIYYITGSSGGADGITSTFPIYSMADLKGKKIRGGGIKGKVLTALGAVDVKIAPGEIYTALQRGIIDGACMPVYVYGEWGFFEVTKYVSLPTVFANWWVDWACNLDAWKKLPPEYQNILQEEADALWKWALKVMIPHVEQSEQEKWSKKGIKYITMSDQAVAEIKKVIYPLWDELAAMSPENEEVVNLYREYLGIK